LNEEGDWEGGLMGESVRKSGWWKEHGIDLQSHLPSSQSKTTNKKSEFKQEEEDDEVRSGVREKMEGWVGWHGEDCLARERRILFDQSFKEDQQQQSTFNHFLIVLQIQTPSPSFQSLIKSKLVFQRKLSFEIKSLLSQTLNGMNEGGDDDQTTNISNPFPILSSRVDLRVRSTINRDIPTATSSISSIILGGTSSTFQKRCLEALGVDVEEDGLEVRIVEKKLRLGFEECIKRERGQNTLDS